LDGSADFESTSHLIFDFFGTLVDYSPSRTTQGYSESCGFRGSEGGQLDYSAFVERWSAGFSELDASTNQGLREYSMVEADPEGTAPVDPQERIPSISMLEAVLSSV
jgi:putative hydrolase of the HAD superfamily